MEIEFYGLPPQQKDAILKYRPIVMWLNGNSYSDMVHSISFLKGTLSKLTHKFLEFSDVLFYKRKLNHLLEVLSMDNKDLIRFYTIRKCKSYS